MGGFAKIRKISKIHSDGNLQNIWATEISSGVHVHVLLIINPLPPSLPKVC